MNDYRGKKMLQHLGGASGFVCWIGLVPQERLGVYVGVSTPSLLVQPLGYWLVDVYLGDLRRDWSAEMQKNQRELPQREKARVKWTRPTLPLVAYTGVYNDGGANGEATVTIKDGKLVLGIGVLSAVLEHWHYETFRIPPYTWFHAEDPLDPARKRRTFGGFAPPVTNGTFVTFVLDRSGKVEEMRVEVEEGPGVKDGMVGTFNRER